MSVIQYIRDKASWLIIALVILSLVGFILMDSSISKATLFWKSSNVAGKIAGKQITNQEYQIALDKAEKQYARNGTLKDADRLYIANNVFEQLKEEKVMSDAYERVGLRFDQNEMQFIFSGQVELGIFRSVPFFVDQQTGRVNMQNVRQYLLSLQQQASQNEEAKQSLANFLEELQKSAIREKYVNALKGVQRQPRWLVNYQIALGKQAKRAEVLSIPYYQIGVDKEKVEEKDIDPFVAKYETFKSPQEARKIEYIVIDGNPTSEDSAEILSSMNAAKAGLASGVAPNELSSQTTATIDYAPDYYASERDLRNLFPKEISSILSPARRGQIIGPFIDAPLSSQDKASYHVVKVIRQRKVPQYVSARHILVAVTESRTEQEAKKLIDSVAYLAKSGADFNRLAATFSDDGGSKEKGGRYDFSYAKDYLSLDSTFSKAIFYNPMGMKRVIKTQFGYHYVEIMNQSDMEEGYEFIHVHQSIEPSVKTETQSYNAANQFSIVAQSKGFQPTAKESKRRIMSSDFIEYSKASPLPQVDYSRDLVAWIFKAEEGDVSAPIKAGNKYVVARLANIFPPEQHLHDELKEKLSPIVQKEKAAQALLAQTSSLDMKALAAKYAARISSAMINGNDLFARDSSATLYEPELVGAILNAKNKAGKTVGPIVGKSSVFFIANVQDAPPLASEGAAAIEQRNFFVDMQGTGYIEQYAVSAYIGSLKSEDRRSKL